jgi:hypothetical protein
MDIAVLVIVCHLLLVLLHFKVRRTVIINPNLDNAFGCAVTLLQHGECCMESSLLAAIGWNKKG